MGEASVKGDSRSWKKDGIAKNFGCGTDEGVRPLHILSVFFYAGVMACVAVGLFAWFLQPFFDGVFAEFHF